jgi:hypothetical protein
VIEGVDIPPELIERVAVHVGDRYIPLVAVLLSRSISYVAKRVLLNDCKEMVMRCNNPLTALLIGQHITRSAFFFQDCSVVLDGKSCESQCENGPLSRMTLVHFTTLSCNLDPALSTKIGSKYQSVILVRLLTVMLFRKRYF